MLLHFRKVCPRIKVGLRNFLVVYCTYEVRILFVRNHFITLVVEQVEAEAILLIYDCLSC
jgi:hypothetical protein